MQTEVIIIGQGIAGTFLAHYLKKSGISFVVIDEPRTNTASKTASGLINPVTGRRIVKTWLIEELMAFAKNAYREIGADLGIDCFTETKIIEFFPSAQMRSAFLDRYGHDRSYLSLPADENDQVTYFNYALGYGAIEPVYLIELQPLLSSFRKSLVAGHRLLEGQVDREALKIDGNKIHYSDITAHTVIFCDGAGGFSNSFFNNLPFALNKGEALIIEMEEFPGHFVFKKGLNLVPLKNNLFWVGSSYQWEFADDRPNKIFRERTELALLDWLKMPFRVLEHLAALRPATVERRPFVGFHPMFPNIGILNGMGTKGCSLAPYFAWQLAERLLKGTPIDPQADIQRFAGILRRN